MISSDDQFYKFACKSDLSKFSLDKGFSWTNNAINAKNISKVIIGGAWGKPLEIHHYDT